MRPLFIALCAISTLSGPANGQVIAPQGTQPLTVEGDLSALMVRGIDRFLMRELDQSITNRDKLWQRDFASAAAYEKSIATNRNRLRERIGAMDNRLPVADLEYVGSIESPARVAET